MSVEVIGLILMDDSNLEWDSTREGGYPWRAVGPLQTFRHRIKGSICITVKGTPTVPSPLLAGVTTVVLDPDHVEMTGNAKCWRRTADRCREAAINWAIQMNQPIVWVIGCGDQWSDLLPICDGLEIHRVKEVGKGNTYVPSLDSFEKFNEVKRMPVPEDKVRSTIEFWRKS